jgi:CubicO group peptidase (beta-lactamase class C family)
MKHHRKGLVLPWFVFAMLAATGIPGSGQQPKTVQQGLVEVKPEVEGFSSQRLDRLHGLLQKEVDDKQFPGIVTVMARHGKVVDFRAYGKSDLASGAPMTKDAIFRIYSMTKRVTGVAMMILYEQGKWSPGDPIAKYIPEFAHLKVLKGLDATGQPILEEPAHAPTMGKLMSHTAGFTYGIFGERPVDKMCRDAAVLGAPNLQGMIDRLAEIPLLYQPRTKWIYSVSVDIQGYIVEKLSGKTLGEYMSENIFQPLGMSDTSFHVDAARRSRFATLYRANEKGELPPSGGGNVAMDYSKEPAMPSGGGGLISTTVDYLRFYQMLLNGGELDGKRILSPSSVARELAALERAGRRRGPKLSGQKADARERRYNT